MIATDIDICIEIFFSIWDVQFSGWVSSKSVYNWTILYNNLVNFFLLIFQNFNAKLSDFGMAKTGPAGENSHVTTRVMGTFGYAAPEYVATGNRLNLAI